MNSSLQCLSHAGALTQYLLSEAWRADLNTGNPMGLNGEVAVQYAGLVYSLWTSERAVRPSMFKATIGRFNSMFAGYYQQDSQEFLGALLDGLHEDLNRIKNKPYTTLPEMEGWTDDKIAEECWRVYTQRNASVIVDLFQGMYRSTVQCVVCGIVV